MSNENVANNKSKNVVILICVIVLALLLCCCCGLSGIAIKYVWGRPGTEAASVFLDAKRSVPPPSTGSGATTEAAQVGLESPFLFDGDNCPPEDANGCSLDVGIKPNQLGLVFGWHIMWPDQGLDAGGDGCDMILLQPGWYEDLWMLDARYEVYDLPEADRQGWIEVLATQRADEQAADYGCPSRDYSDIPWWKSGIPSPPAGIANISPIATSEQAQEPASPAVSQPTRRATGQNQTLTFEQGEVVYGYRIVLNTGAKCDGGGCYLPSAPTSGSVTSGVINPWPSEVQGVESWVPES